MPKKMSFPCSNVAEAVPKKAVAKAELKKEHCEIAQKKLFHAPSSASDAALDEQEGMRGQHPRHAFIAWFAAHPAFSVACPELAFVAELTAHPLYCLASRSSVQRWEVMFRCRAPLQAHAQQWNV
jgi:hypothetical protein